jgi:hypothetical protein
MLNYRLTALQRVRCPTGANRAILCQRHEHRNGRTRRIIFGSSRRTPRGFWVAELVLPEHRVATEVLRNSGHPLSAGRGDIVDEVIQGDLAGSRWFSHPTPASLEGPVRSCGPIGGSMGTLGFAFLAALASNADLHAEWVWWVIVSAPGVLLAATWPEARSKPKADGSQLPATYQPRELTSPGPSAP